jgi:hypothetical protein
VWCIISLGVRDSQPPVHDTVLATTVITYAENAPVDVRKIRFLVLFAALALCGCSLASYITSSSSDYNIAVEDTTDNLLVTNILRGGENAPLFFSDLAQIRGSLQTSVAGQATWPFGPFDHDSMRTNSLQAGPLSLQTNPTFDIAPLNTKEFAQGINEPVSVGLLWYYLQRFNPAVILSLFVSRIERVDEVSTAADGSQQIVRMSRLQGSDKTRMIGLWVAGNDNGTPPKVNVYTEASAVGPVLPSSVLQQRSILADLAQASAAGLQVKFEKSDNLVHTYKTMTHAVLCVASDPDLGSVHYQALAIAASSVVSNPAAVEWPKSAAACTTLNAKSDPSAPSVSPQITPGQILVHLRSVEAIFYWLGMISAVDNELQHDPTKKLANDELEARILNCYIKFHVQDHPVANERFHVAYRGTTYYVANGWDPEDADPPCSGDNTIAILGLLNDLLNLRRDANEIPTTKAVQSVP